MIVPAGTGESGPEPEDCFLLICSETALCECVYGSFLDEAVCRIDVPVVENYRVRTEVVANAFCEGLSCLRLE